MQQLPKCTMKVREAKRKLTLHCTAIVRWVAAILSSIANAYCQTCSNTMATASNVLYEKQQLGSKLTKYTHKPDQKLQAKIKM